MPTTATGQLSGPIDALCTMFAASATFAADAVASGAVAAADRVHAVARDDETAGIDTGRPFVVVYDTRKAAYSPTLGPFGQVELEGRIEYAIADGDSEREAYVKFGNKIDAIAAELEALAYGSGGLVGFFIEFDEPAMRPDPNRQDEQFYTAAFKVKCGLEG